MNSVWIVLPATLGVIGALAAWFLMAAWFISLANDAPTFRGRNAWGAAAALVLVTGVGALTGIVTWLN